MGWRGRTGNWAVLGEYTCQGKVGVNYRQQHTGLERSNRKVARGGQLSNTVTYNCFLQQACAIQQAEPVWRAVARDSRNETSVNALVFSLDL